jgi:hypothetical protein
VDGVSSETKQTGDDRYGKFGRTAGGKAAEDENGYS